MSEGSWLILVLERRKGERERGILRSASLREGGKYHGRAGLGLDFWELLI